MAGYRTKKLLRCVGGAALVAAALALLGPTHASGQSRFVPPGNSVTDQYTETFPWVSGDRTGPNANRDPRKGLGERNAELLEQADEEGEEIATVLASTGPPVSSAPDAGGQAAGTAGRSTRRGGGGDESPGRSSGGTNASAVVGAATGLTADEGSTAPLLPILLLTALVFLTALAVSLWRRRAGTDS